MDWAQSSPHLLQKGVPSSEGPGHVSAGPTLPQVCARDSSSRPSFPSRYLARSLRVTIPTTCQERDRVQPRVGTEPGDSVSLSPGGAQAAQTLTSLRLSTTTKCRSPRARKSLNTRGRDASCKAQRG